MNFSKLRLICCIFATIDMGAAHAQQFPNWNGMDVCSQEGSLFRQSCMDLEDKYKLESKRMWAKASVDQKNECLDYADKKWKERVAKDTKHRFVSLGWDGLHRCLESKVGP